MLGSIASNQSFVFIGLNNRSSSPKGQSIEWYYILIIVRPQAAQQFDELFRSLGSDWDRLSSPSGVPGAGIKAFWPALAYWPTKSSVSVAAPLNKESIRK
jgi:hypothetical protein